VADLRFALFGAGFWAPYQLAAWRELKGVCCVAICNRSRDKAERLAQESGVAAFYDDPEALIREQRLDFIDIVTAVEVHRPLVELAARSNLPVICQKPLASSLADAEAMVAVCRAADVPLFVHENWRWQTPLRRIRQLLDEGSIGRVFRARVSYVNSYPVFENQPFLRELEQFILADIGTHILDTARMLFGEAKSLHCRTARVHEDIQGEDVATVMLGMRNGATVTCEMSYASRVEHDRFPETYLFIEGQEGSIELAPDYWIRLTTNAGTLAQRCPPPFYAWADPRYALVQVAGVDCCANLLAALRGEALAETTGEDNLRTLQLVFGAYESVRSDQVVSLEG
jgi:predicted dehydrogenase